MTADPKRIDFEHYGVTATEDRDRGESVTYVLRRGQRRVGTAEVPAGPLIVRCDALAHEIRKL